MYATEYSHMKHCTFVTAAAAHVSHFPLKHLLPTGPSYAVALICVGHAFLFCSRYARSELHENEMRESRGKSTEH